MYSDGDDMQIAVASSSSYLDAIPWIAQMASPIVGEGMLDMYDEWFGPHSVVRRSVHRDSRIVRTYPVITVAEPGHT